MDHATAGAVRLYVGAIFEHDRERRRETAAFLASSGALEDAVAMLVRLSAALAHDFGRHLGGDPLLVLKTAFGPSRERRLGELDADERRASEHFQAWLTATVTSNTAALGLLGDDRRDLDPEQLLPDAAEFFRLLVKLYAAKRPCPVADVLATAWWILGVPDEPATVAIVNASSLRPNDRFRMPSGRWAVVATISTPSTAGSRTNRVVVETLLGEVIHFEGAEEVPATAT